MSTNLNDPRQRCKEKGCVKLINSHTEDGYFKVLLLMVVYKLLTHEACSVFPGLHKILQKLSFSHVSISIFETGVSQFTF